MSNDFESLQKFKEYCDYYGLAYIELEDISSEKRKYYYMPPKRSPLYNNKDNKMVEFDTIEDKGKLFTYPSLKEKLLNENIDLAKIMAKFWGGIRYLRLNYIEYAERLKDLQNNFSYFLDEINTKLGIDYKSWQFTNEEFYQLNIKLIIMNELELVQVEIPLTILFLLYAQQKYNNTFEIVQSKNVIEEPILSIDLITLNNRINFSDLVLRVLFPDFNRDDYDREEDVIISISGLKSLIDYYNGNKFVKVHPE
ncbi:hypothetical protein GXP67_21270 [Rhodocytophaga rosea]|uniref:Uncharacterized protein n=1 Tax=Rhodocytophaga rosea TaxID=2704465 RepID=A0A6C0GLW9_9BACT|nr:hypothetical protein [Rhodocytophaga rosea]QHT68999.1 hypothetical protein GXP67_21270 [Rhodocytophaga rosea]